MEIMKPPKYGVSITEAASANVLGWARASFI